MVEYRRHGSKYYIVSGWGAGADWYQNILQDNRVTIQHGSHIVDARAQRVENPAEALRALYMFSRNSWIYETLFARMSSAQAADLSTLAEVVDEFTVVRLEPTEEAPALPVIDPFSPSVRQFAAFLVLLVGWRLALSLLRPHAAKSQGRRRGSLILPLAHFASNIKFDALRQRQFTGIIDRIGLPPHISLPGIGAGFASAAGFLLATESAADFRSARADIDVGNATIRTGMRQEALRTI